MLYYIVKFLSKIGFRVYFRKIYFTDPNSANDNKAIIYAVNHPTAFLDPVLVGTFIDPIVHFIVRGDIFNSKTVRSILASLKMYPIFRFRDGYANLKNNQATMDFCYKTLSEGKNLLVLAEGQTKHEKRLRPIQKGTARMAFGAIEKYGELDIIVVPIGVNYTDSHRFRSEVMIKTGKAISLKDLMPVYKENPRKAVKQLTDSISDELKKLVIHIADESDDEMVNQLLDIQRNDIEKNYLPTLSGSDTLLKKEYNAVDTINKMEVENKTSLKSAIEDYQEELRLHGCEDIGVAQPQKYNIINSILVILGFIPFLVSVFINGLPLLFSKEFADAKIKKIEFHSSVRYGVGLVGYLIYWLFFLTIALIIGNKIFLGIVIAAPILGFYSLFYEEILGKWKSARNFKSLAKEVQNVLKNKRTLIFKTLFDK